VGLAGENAAFSRKRGQSDPERPAAWRKPAGRRGVALPAPPPSAFAVTEPADAAWLQRHLGPMPLQTYIGTYTFQRSGSNGLKRTCFASINPRYPLLVPTQDRIRGDKTWSFATLETGHNSMVTAPEDLASLLMVV
jgi:hypothetical protein